MTRAANAGVCLDQRPAGFYLKRATSYDSSRYYDVTLLNPKVLVGVFLGSMSVCLCSTPMTMKAVGRAAKGMVEEVRARIPRKARHHAGDGEARLRPARGHQHQGGSRR